MPKYLLNSEPLLVQKELAMMFGLTEALILQQIHYWLKKNKERHHNFHKGTYWVWNTIEGWHTSEFPFFSPETIKRALNKLRTRKVLRVDHFNKRSYDKTLWYTIDYAVLDALEEEFDTHILPTIDFKGGRIQKKQLRMALPGTLGPKRPNGQNDPMEKVKKTRPIPETTSEITCLIVEARKNKKFTHAFNDFCIYDSETYRKDTAWKLFTLAMNYEASLGDIIQALEICVEKGKVGSLAYFAGIVKNKVSQRKKGMEPFGKPKWKQVEDYTRERMSAHMEYVTQYQIDHEKMTFTYRLKNREDYEVMQDFIKLVLGDIKIHTGIILDPVYD